MIFRRKFGLLGFYFIKSSSANLLTSTEIIARVPCFSILADVSFKSMGVRSRGK